MHLGAFELPLRVAAMRALGMVERELDWFIASIPPGRIGIDAGASWGVYARAMACVCAHVEAFEPQRECAESLRAYARRFAPAIHVQPHAPASQPLSVLQLKQHHTVLS
jgi:hypothetical protein